jgi:2-methylfumaryl-CoA isomerase
VKLALEDVALAAMGNLGFIAEAQLGQERARHGNELFGAFGRDFLCADGERVIVIGLTGKQWRSLCEAVEMTEAMARLGERLGLDLAREGNRFLARREIGEVVGAWISRHSLAQVSAAFERHGVCWGPYQTIRQMVERGDACSPANPMFANIEQPGVGEVLAPGIPLSFSGLPRLPAAPAPRLGEHTESVLAELLGIDAAQFGKLHDKGVVAVPG